MYTIRKYKNSDRERLRYICKETVFDGNKESKDRLESIAIIYNDYYTAYEPDNIFVAVNGEDIPVGYIICSSDKKMYFSKMKKEFLKKTYSVYPGSVPMFIANLCAVKLAPKDTGVHLHIDLLPEAQHRGLGTKMINTLARHLYSKGYEHVSVCGINMKSHAYNFYRHLGFYHVQDLAPYIVTLTYDTKKAASE